MLSFGKASYWRSVNPTGALADFRAVWRAAGVRRWPFVAAALAMTTGVFYVIVQESWRGPLYRPTVTYINSWTAGRSDAEIEREIIANQRYQDKLAAEQAVREAKVREIYRTLGQVSGMDVDAIEKQAKEDAARDKAEHDKAIGMHSGPVNSGNAAAPAASEKQSAAQR